MARAHWMVTARLYGRNGPGGYWCHDKDPIVLRLKPERADGVTDQLKPRHRRT
jgi:hypothetical protein